MKNLVRKNHIVLLILLCFSLLQACQGADAWMGPLMVGGSTPTGCSASYEELTTDGTAVDATVNLPDADATTGWTGSTLSIFDSVQDSDSTCVDGESDCPAANSGTYHFTGSADGGSNDNFNIQIGSSYDLSTGDFIRLQFDYLGDGVNTWKCGIGMAAGVTNTSETTNCVSFSGSSYATHTSYAAIREGMGSGDNDYFSCVENNASNAGTAYLDAFSVSIATLCYGTPIYNGSGADNPSSEADALGGWVSGEVGTMELQSVDADDECAGTPGDCEAAHDGTYHVWFNPNGNNGALAYVDLNAMGLEDATKYRLDMYIMSAISSTDNNKIGLNDAANTSTISQPLFVIGYGDSSYMLYSTVFTHDTTNYRYLVVYENGGNNNEALYIDSFQVREVTGE